MASIPAACVDARHARVHPAELTIADDVVSVIGESFERRAPIAAVEITDAIGSAPRLVRFTDGACCEPLDQKAFADLLAAQGIGRSRLAVWEQSAARIAASLLALVVVLTLAYRFALPAAARVIADRMPDVAIHQLSAQTLLILDRTLFGRTSLPVSRQTAIVLAFDRLQLPPAGGGRRYDVQFRKADSLGPNAMALPSGAMIVTDALVELARDDREILGVLAHEAGHVDRRHGLRQILQGSAVALFLTWFVGDMHAVAAAAPTALLQAKYSRDLEREADDFAGEVLRRNGIATGHLAAMLERLESAHGGKTGARGPSALDYLSTHPATAERLDRLRAR
jgi:Zn-dependent protease with chaperone function